MNRINYCIFLFLMVVLGSCTGSETPDRDTGKDASGRPADIPEAYLNADLARDAREGVTYNGQFFCVLTENETPLYDVNGVAAGKTVPRGTVFSKIPNANGHTAEGYIPVMIGEEKTYLPIRSAYFRQEVEGMRYPLYGIVQSDGESATYYDERQQKDVTIPLEPGTVYLYELTKDKSYINVWDGSAKAYVTVEYCCKAQIIQAEDHAKVLRRFRTKMNRILPQ